MARVYGMMMANEVRTTHAPPKYVKNDRHLFVYNLGILLSQTREGVAGAYLDDTEIVHVVFRNGQEHLVNVRGDSYLDIIRDVTKEI